MKRNIDQILEDIRNGHPVIVTDEPDRENEGDLLISAQMADEYNLAFMMLHARGLMCIPCAGDVLDRLQVPLMVSKTNDPLETPFTVSVDSIKTTTGMSVFDRLETISVFTDDTSTVEQLKFPGHLFPLRARKQLLLERRGHTEASIELMKLAGLKEVAIITEIMNPDGTMSKGKDLEQFARMYNLKFTSITEIYEAVYNKSL